MNWEILGNLGMLCGILIAYAILFLINKKIKKLKILIEQESKTRKEQDWKLYNLIKSNFNVMTNKRMNVEDKIDEASKGEQDGLQEI